MRFIPKKPEPWGIMKWYGRRGTNEVFLAPDGSRWEVVNMGNQSSSQRVAYEAWTSSRRKRGGG